MRMTTWMRKTPSWNLSQASRGDGPPYAKRMKEDEESSLGQMTQLAEQSTPQVATEARMHQKSSMKKQMKNWKQMKRWKKKMRMTKRSTMMRMGMEMRKTPSWNLSQAARRDGVLDELPGAEARCWYAAKAIEHNWSRNVLVMHIETRLQERSGAALTNFPARLPKPLSDLAREHGALRAQRYGNFIIEELIERALTYLR